MQDQSKELKNKFSLAIDLSQNGQAETAIQIWDQLSTVQIVPGPDIDQNEFITKVNLYKAWTFMDLEQFKEAFKVFESNAIKASIPFSTKDCQYEYYFSYANTAGEVGDQQKMEAAYLEAMKVAKELNNINHIKKCWINLLYYAEENGWWKYLEQAARTCIVFAEGAEDARLGLSAGIRRAKALANLGKAKRAEIQAKRIIQVALQFEENEACDKAQEFLNDLEHKRLEGQKSTQPGS